MSTDPFARTVDGRTQLTLQAGFGWLLVLGIAHASEDWSRDFAVWSIGRSTVVGCVPRALTFALGCCALMYVSGVRPRWSGLAACGLLGALDAVVPATYHNNYYLLALMVFITAWWAHPGYRFGWFFSPVADPAKASVVVPWLVRAQLVITYLGSAAVKLTHPWWQGTGRVIRWAANERIPETLPSWWNLLLRPVLSHPLGSALADTLVTALEVLIPLGLLTSRRRRLALGAAACLHIFMQEWLFPQLFTFLMLLGLYAFVPSGDHAWRVRYNPGHPLDHTLAKIFARVDWLGRTEWAPSPDATELSATHTDGTTLAGASVLRLLGVLTPVSVLLWATLSLGARGTHTFFTIPRPMVENTVIAIVALAYVPGLTDWLYRRGRGALAGR